MDQNYISISASLLYIPPLVDAFSPITLEISVILHKTAITRPITRVIEKGGLNENNIENRILAKFDKTRQNFVDLFNLLKLNKKNETLIKMQKNQDKISIFEKDGRSLDDIHLLTKNNEFLKLDVKNPFQKLPKQKSLFDFSTTHIDSSNGLIEKRDEIKRIEVKNEVKAENLDVDYGKLLKLDSENTEEIQLSEPPPTFVTKLHDYQKQALTWLSILFSEVNYLF